MLTQHTSVRREHVTQQPYNMDSIMTDLNAIDQRKQRCLAELEARGQGHLLRWWDQLDANQQEDLLDKIESIPWTVIDPLMESHVRTKPVTKLTGELTPAPIFRSNPEPAQQSYYLEAVVRGKELIRAGKVAAFTVAGGQGARLGFDGPKGCVAVTPVGDRTLFEIFAAQVKAVRQRYAENIPWYVMTSQANHDQTLSYFESNHFFDLPREDVVLFSQGMLPAFDFEGRVLMEEKHRISFAPDGHGGSLKALVASGALKDMQDRGVEIISYFQVDNPLVKPFDPLFMGLHDKAGSEMSTKVTPKAHDMEKVGNVCLRDGQLSVIEYSEFPDDLACAKNEDGGRKFDAGNIAIHLLNVDFVDRVVGQSFQMPFRRAEKIVSFVDERGQLQKPQTPNAIKLESFIFDALPLANNPMVLEVLRAEEFSPVKNAAGVDSLESARRDQIARAYRWIENAGVSLPRKVNGEPDASVIIFPTFALSSGDVADKKESLPEIKSGECSVLE